MSSPVSREPGLAGATPLVLPRVARSHVDALDADAPLRLLIAGTAGAGKTRLLRHIVARMTAQGREVAAFDPQTPVAEVPASTLLVVDDAHLLEPGVLVRLHARLADPAASVVLTARPWPHSEALHRLAADLEHTQPALVLGHVTRADVVEQLSEDGRTIDARCLDSLLELSGGLTWLACEALALHADDGCDDAADHPALRDDLREFIAHRVAALDEQLRAAIELVCLTPQTLPPGDAARWYLAGHAKGLLQRNGRPAPVVREAVRATTSIDRLVEVYTGAEGAVLRDPVLRELVGAVHDPRVAATLLLDGDGALAREPRRAEELYRAAGEAGADPRTVKVRRALAEWAAGEIDAAGTLLDAHIPDPAHATFSAAVSLSAAVWAARGDMRMAATVLDAAAPSGPDAVANATVAAVGAGDTDILARLAVVPAARVIPTTLVVAQELVARGLRATLTAGPGTCLSDLVRATEMYTASATNEPVPELPAVLAALAALSLGDLSVAHTVLETAVRERHGGGWARPRLLLWAAWTSVQRERPHDAELALRAARGGGPLAPRERVLADAVEIALTRRYADPSALMPVWRTARESILRARFDLYSFWPLGEFAMSAARLGDLADVAPHLDDAAHALERLGSPPLWSAPLHWAGLHCSILMNRPDDMVPHARALLAAAPHSRLAHTMAGAGRIWTDVLTGKVDADAIEGAAFALAGVGLAWDGARLAGQGAGRSEDRRVVSRLLACARQLHPREELDTVELEAEPADNRSGQRTPDGLSAREREVAALVLQGKTYAEIGESIFISPRTAEHHIARIRRRLGATSRSDLIAKLRLVLDDAVDATQLLPLARSDAF